MVITLHPIHTLLSSRSGADLPLWNTISQQVFLGALDIFLDPLLDKPGLSLRSLAKGSDVLSIVPFQRIIP